MVGEEVTYIGNWDVGRWLVGSGRIISSDHEMVCILDDQRDVVRFARVDRVYTGDNAWRAQGDADELNASVKSVL